MNRREALRLLPNVWALAFGARCVAGSPPIRRSKPFIEGLERGPREAAHAAEEIEDATGGFLLPPDAKPWLDALHRRVGRK